METMICRIGVTYVVTLFSYVLDEL